MVSTTIIFKKDNVQPPVFVAGGFTDWSPVEMTYETTESNGSVENVFFHKTQLEPGEYQYKFRLGPGDWWVLDESAPKATDELGNVNNVLSVEPEEGNPSPEPPVETIPTLPAHVLNTEDAHIKDDEPKANGSADQEQSPQPYPPPEEVVPKLVDSHAQERATVDTEQPRAETEKQVQVDEQTGKVPSETGTPRKNSIPDFAPPPYSVSATGTVPDPNEKVQVAPVAEAAPQKQLPSEPAAIKDEMEGKEQSLVARVCSAKSLVLVAVMVAIPVAVSYYLRR